MELRQLESFLAVADELHFGRAAERVHLSQPALSQQIKRLERELGVELFARTQRSVALTAAGAALLEPAARILADTGDLASIARRAADGSTGTLGLGYVGSALFSVVPPLMQALADEAPGIEITMVERKTEEQLDAMRRGELDVGVIKQPQTAPAGFDVVPVFTETIGVALPDGHRHAGKDTIDLVELADDPFVIFPRNAEPDTFDTLMAACTASGFTARIAQTGTSLQTVLGLVASGIGVAFVVESVMANSRRDGVRYVRLTPPTPSLTTALAFPIGATNPAVDVFADIARRHLSD
ncbi:MAG: LysR family transcriptional regulator [Actinomycetota bacterium]